MAYEDGTTDCGLIPQDYSCEDREDECRTDLGLTCAQNIVDRKDSGHTESICVPEEECEPIGLIEYTPTYGSLSPDIWGVDFEFTSEHCQDDYNEWSNIDEGD